ncbi:MAG: hypothetical protein WBA67_13320, partial [Jannaschia sp.]
MTDRPDLPGGQPPPEDDPSVVMGEYVLGLLSDAETRALESRIAREPALQRLNAEWNAALQTMTAGRDVSPPPALRGTLEERLFGAEAPERPRSGKRLFGWLGLFGGPAVAFAAALFLLTPGSGFDPRLHVDLASAQIGLSIA